jgi:hypothetical protein
MIIYFLMKHEGKLSNKEKFITTMKVRLCNSTPWSEVSADDVIYGVAKWRREV